ncbi:hypothetical protein [Paenibacillus sp. sgz5001063]|uniref:hypothetical protein n=1 Tax=Paenibacillus sp. sgz5001063 TaxID=3242474 RepID=UPI0036D32759
MTTGGAASVGEIRARITLEMTEFRRQLEEARRRIRELEGDTRRGADGFRDMGGAIAGLAAGAGLSKLVNEMQRAVNEATKLHSAFAGLAAVAKGFGVQTKDANAAVQDLASRGFLTLTEAAQAYKTALSTGLSLDESTKLINSLADSAAYGRQSFYTMGGAIQASLDGIKNGNSVLSDAVGVTKNLSTMQKEYAASIGTTVGKLTDAEKIQAAYNGFISEGSLFVGNADEAMQGFTGTQARFTQATNEASVAFGQAFTPLFQTVLETLTPTIIALADFVTENKAMVSAVAATAVGVLGLVTVLATVPPALKLIAAGFKAVELSAGPVGWLILAVGALAGGIGYLTTAHSEATAATKALAQAQTDLNAVLNKAPIDRTVADVEELKSKTEELTPVLEERARLQERLNELNAAQDNGTWMPEMFAETMDINEAIGELDEKLEKLGYTGVEQATEKLGEMNAFVKAGTIAITDQEKAEAQALATKKQTLKEMSAYAAEFKKLNAAQELDASQKGRLVDITDKLIEQYPELNAQQGEDGRIRADNIDTIISQIDTDKRFTDQAAANVTTRIRNFAKENEAQAKAVQAQIDNLTRLSNALAVVSGANASTFADDMAARVEANQRSSSGKVGDIVTNGVIAQMATSGAKSEVDARIAEELKKQQKYADASRELEKLAAEVESGTQTFNKDVIAPDPEKGPKAKKEKAGKSPAELAAEMRKKLYDQELATVQYQSEFYNLTADKQIEKYEALKKKHAQFLKESVDDARTLSLQLKNLSEDSVKSRYDFSATWIEAESKRMEDSGKTELSIAEMKLASWTRLRDRYAKDSEQYKAADEQRRQARKDVASATEAAARDQYDASAKWIDAEERRMSRAGKSEADITQMKIAAWTRVRDRYSKDSEYYAKADEQLYQLREDLTKQTVALADDLVKAQKDAINDAKKADLDAIEERKQAALDEYDARIDAIQKLRDANKELNADADYETQLTEKRARAAELQSAVGPAGIEERNAVLKEIERMQLEHDRELTDRSLETQQDALKDEKDAQSAAFDKEKSAAEAQYDALLNAFDAYSGNIKTVEDGIAAYRVSASGAANSAILTELDAFVAQYNAKMADISAPKATPKTNGAGSALVGPAAPIAALSGGIPLSSQQQATLWGALATPRVASTSPAAPTYITQQIDMSVNDVELSGKADISTLYDERTRAAARLAAMGVKTL